MTQTREEAFHEIQLNGKQLFFLFMSTTIVSVVIFLCGVLVGRSVRAERAAAAETEALTTTPSAEAPLAGATLSEPATTDLTVVPPPPTEEEPARSTTAQPQPAAAEPAATSSKPAVSPKPESKPAPPPAPAPAPAAASAPARVAAAASTPPAQSQGGVAVQVAALATQRDAEAEVRRLGVKGYDAYIVPPQDGNITYRVRIGSYKTRAEANLLADKLRREGEKPFIPTR